MSNSSGSEFDATAVLEDSLKMGLYAPLWMHGEALEDTLNEFRAATGYTRVETVNRYLEEVTTYEEQRPWMRTLSDGTLLTTIAVGLGWWLAGSYWPYQSVLLGISLGWWLVGGGVLLTYLFGAMTGDVEQTVETRRRADSYYPPKEYWEAVDHEAIETDTTTDGAK